MVGKHVAEFELERALVRKIRSIQSNTPMPYGYPLAVYRPMHVCKLAQVKRFVAKTGGTMSNGVPRVLRADQVGQYLLGIYNPGRSQSDTRRIGPRCVLKYAFHL